MKNKNLHINILIIFQLLVFAGPYAIKSAHHHNFYSYLKNENICLLTVSDQPCTICKFEFVTGFIIDKTLYFVFQPLISLNNPLIDKQVYNENLIYFSLRAPPLA